MNEDYNWEHIIDSFRDQQVLVIGDAILDRYTYGSVERISPEAPVPVMVEKSQSIALGGAANVARCISMLGGSCKLYSVIGQDNNGSLLLDLLERSGVSFCGKIEGITEVKSRMIASGQQLFRIDLEGSRIPLGPPRDLTCDGIVVSDYAKGVFNAELASWCVCQEKVVVVDSKPLNMKMFKGADLFTPNLKEASEVVGMDHHSAYEGDVAEAFVEALDGSVLVTCGNCGMYLMGQGKFKIPPFQVECKDPTGAGDVVTACMGLCMAAGIDSKLSALIANRAAGISVTKLGTYAVSAAELRESLMHTDLAPIFLNEESLHS